MTTPSQPSSSAPDAAAASAPAIVEFPLRGEWRAVNTPAERVPSHGTDFFAQRYAYDFTRMDAAGTRYGSAGLVRQFLGVMSASAFFAWDQPVASVFRGRVLAAKDGAPDRALVNSLWEAARSVVSPPTIAGGDYRPLAGNHVIVEGDVGIALFAHLRHGSIRVRRGDRVEPGEVLGAVGNSGNTTMPHLHFQLMDGPDPLYASGLPCAFARYERYAGGAWEPIVDGMPGFLERVRVPARDD